jgi:hypothetical protein
MKKAILKRTADALEKMAIASAVMGLFDDKQIGIVIAAGCISASYIFTYWRPKNECMDIIFPALSGDCGFWRMG